MNQLNTSFNVLDEAVCYLKEVYIMKHFTKAKKITSTLRASRSMVLFSAKTSSWDTSNNGDSMCWFVLFSWSITLLFSWSRTSLNCSSLSKNMFHSRIKIEQPHNMIVRFCLYNVVCEHNPLQRINHASQSI